MQNIMAHRRALYSAIMIGISILAADISIAQQGIEEVVVTARKREENVQDVPMAIAAFSAEQLARNQVSDITDLQKMTPNITINETSGLLTGAIQIFVRGIGNDPGFDQGVGIYVDDVYLNHTGGAVLDVYDIERIEVLKGPQGQLYGRNTIGGAIKYISREPGDALEAGLEGQVGSDNLVRLKGNISGPLMPGQLFGGFAFATKHRDGYQRNIYDGSRWADADVQSFRGTLVWSAAEALRVKVVADHSRDDSRPGIPGRLAVNAVPVQTISARLIGANGIYGPGTAILDEASDLSLPSNVDKVRTAHVHPGFKAVEIETSSIAGTITWDLAESLVLKSVTAYREVKNPRAFDYDGSIQRFIDSNSYIKNKDFSQELQLNFSGETVQAVIGAYYLDGQYSITEPGTTLQTTRLRFFSDHLKTTWRDTRDLNSISLYATTEWEFAEGWQLSLGGRYTRDKKEIDIRGTVNETLYPFAITRVGSAFDIFGIRAGQEAYVESRPGFFGWQVNTSAQTLINGGVVTSPVLGSPRISRVVTVSYDEYLIADDSWSEFSPSIKLTRFLNDDLMIYGGYSSGFKAGGFATSGNIVASYEPETVDNYSVGLKSTLLEGTLRLNAEFFYNDYQDKQLSTIEITPDGQLRSTSANVGKVKSSGGEVEIIWVTPMEGLMASLNVGYLDSKIEKYLQAVAGQGVIDVSDNRALGFAPRWTAQARLAYDFDLADRGSVLVAVDVAYRDQIFTDSPVDTTNAFRMNALSDSLTTWNAQMAFTSRDAKWRVALEGKNLSDEREQVNTFVVSNFMTAGYLRGRTWALSLGYKY